MDTSQVPPSEGRPSRQRGGSVVGPVILIGLGALFLLQNLGVISASVWTSILNLWPVLLIILGIELVLGRGSWGSALLIGLLVLVVAAAASFVSFFPWSSGTFRAGPFVAVETVHLAEELGQVQQARYDISYGAGNLDVSALPQSSGNLLEADLERDEWTTIDRNVNRAGDRAQVTIRSRDTDGVVVPGQSSGGGDWAIRLSPQVVSDLKVDTGAGKFNLDLRGTKLSSLDLNTGVGEAKVTLPESAGRTTVKVNAGVGDTEITIPAAVAAQIKVSTGIGGVEIDEGRFVKVAKDLYRSSNYESAANRVDLDLSAGVGALRVR
jgi:hypothetical protein